MEVSSAALAVWEMPADTMLYKKRQPSLVVVRGSVSNVAAGEPAINPLCRMILHRGLSG